MNIQLQTLIDLAVWTSGPEALRPTAAAPTPWQDNTPGATTDQNAAASPMAFRCVPVLDWPANLFA